MSTNKKLLNSYRISNVLMSPKLLSGSVDQKILCLSYPQVRNYSQKTKKLKNCFDERFFTFGEKKYSKNIIKTNKPVWKEEFLQSEATFCRVERKRRDNSTTPSLFLKEKKEKEVKEHRKTATEKKTTTFPFFSLKQFFFEFFFCLLIPKRSIRGSWWLIHVGHNCQMQFATKIQILFIMNFT